MSSLTLPVRTGASPTRLRIAEVSIAGVAPASRDVTTGSAPATAAPPARCRNVLRVVFAVRRIGIDTILVPKRCKVSHDVLDLFRRQDRLAAPARTHAREPIDAIIGRHDRRGIEVRGIDQPQPKLAFTPMAARARETRRE